MIQALTLLLVLGVSSSAVAQEQKELSACEQVVENLGLIHQVLYDVDTRPLAIQQYRNYRNAVEQLRIQQESLSQVCKTTSAGTLQNLVFEKPATWTFSYSASNPCRLDFLTTTIAEFEQTSIRQCYKDGFTKCEIKTGGRAYNLKAQQTSTYAWTCTANIDTVIEATK